MPIYPRDHFIYQERVVEKLTYKTIAAHYGLHPSRIFQIVKRIKEYQQAIKENDDALRN